MVTIQELQEWLKIDDGNDNSTLNSLMLSSKLIIKNSTGVIPEDVQNNPEAVELYKLVQKLIITDLYENRNGSQKISPVLIGLYTQLEVYKLV